MGRKMPPLPFPLGYTWFVGPTVPPYPKRHLDRQFILFCRARINKLSPPGAVRRYAPADGGSTRGGSMSVRGRARSMHMAKLQAASVPIAQGSCAPMAAAPWDRQTDMQTDGSRYRWGRIN